jgi:hypothetical protein
MFNLTNFNPADKLLSFEEAAAMVGTSISTIHRSTMPRYTQGSRTLLHCDDAAARARCRSRRMQPTAWPSAAAAT